jgi:DNA-binding transcriptional ArsR family regulator
LVLVLEKGEQMMPGEADIAAVAALLADPTRATMLLALSDGRAFTTSELAKSAQVALSTASEHLGRLVEAALLAVEKQGRNRFYHLVDPTIVDIMEDLARLAPQVKIHTLRASEHAKALHRARVCYHHLAGTLGVLLTEALVERKFLRGVDAGYVLEEEGATWLHTFGIAIGPCTGQELLFVPRHIDWSERKHHVAGAFGAALADRLFELQWLERHPSSRAVRLTRDGKTGMEQVFRLCF